MALPLARQAGVISRLLRIELFYKILIANSAIVTLGAVAGTLLTVWHEQTYPHTFHYELILLFGAAGLAVSLAANYAALRLALRPLDALQSTVDRVRAGDATARAPAGRLDDARIARLAETFNEMLEGQAAAADELRRLSGGILEAQEEERQRVARELHDQSAQSLTMMLVQVRMLEKAGAIEQVRAHAVELRKLTAQALDEIRRIALELRPKILEDLGLAEALGWRVDEMNKVGGVRATLTVTGLERRLPRDIELALYRVGQEALTNVAWHAKATTVRVALDRGAQAVTLSVDDDGQGFDPSQTAARRGLGLSGMRERLGLVGGDLRIDAAPGRGARLRASVPLKG